MFVETDIEDMQADAQLKARVLAVAQQFVRNLEADLGPLGGPDDQREIRLSNYYGNSLSVRGYGFENVLQAAQQLAKAANVEPPTLKMRFRGSSNGTACTVPLDEWYLIAATNDDGGACVDLRYASGDGYRKTVSWSFTVEQLPAPGYLMAVKETPENASIREQGEKDAKEVEKKAEVARKRREARERNKQLKEHPVIEGPATQKPMLLGPKELSLCGDAPEDIETAQLEEAEIG